ncbi:MAG: YggS family pyridoxal phosphate-dependent enzyme [Deltaproteobacteria bacterium]
MSIYSQILYEVKQFNAVLILVTKTKGNDVIKEYYELGHRDFGENKVQELLPKYENLPKDINWHFIGHLQKNKVKHIAPFIHLIHSVDSFELLYEINEKAFRNNRVIDVLLEIKIASEFTKFGISETDCISILTNPEFKKMNNIRIRGLMGMASFVDSEVTIREEFGRLKSFFVTLRSGYMSNSKCFDILSMGMSGDYKFALETGSTMVRIGSLILGER